ncbi:Na+/H+ antiporter NhaC family protein [Agathobaculum sp.]|uniref:Na+/H+ antiporter NhaC family protein n=1 Tax=Agathobaculum sp. TaxID=2048138 RepID=UPI002A80C4EB|nr:Na+/H+ antiporter NhaC family protein [Agathobaculum sp.]MDY3618774.1 Na+/H+ antiporter NhaC family protein [Agathobaculum sp.]
MEATVWTLLPPIIAIALALITKEVYSSLMIGILTGAMLYANFNPLHAIETTFEVMGGKLGGNINICIFLVLLGILVSLVTKSGASRAYGEWAVSAIKSRRGASFATSFLGVFIFVDDYFNCLTVGTVMRPVTDKHRISRAKLAYIIDATAAPVCIIAPVSSWAAAVLSSLPEGSKLDGFQLFLQTIPFNLYALLTLAFLAFLMASNIDFGPMARYQKNHEKDDLEHLEETHVVAGAGKVRDLIIPIATLIVLCIAGMLYTGGILEGASIVDAFAGCDSSTSLVLGSFTTLIVTALLYLPRKILTFGQFCESFTEGFRAMVPALLILTLAWTLSGVCSGDYLNIGGYVSSVISGDSMVAMLMPAIIFLIALGLAFATGTSWGTFGILIPIIIAVFGDVMSPMLVQTVAACLAGAVCGDHVSPISDTTILASAGAQCNHIDHVATQMPYALLVAVVCFVGYLVGGIAGNGFVALGVGAVLMAVLMVVLWGKNKKKA